MLKRQRPGASENDWHKLDNAGKMYPFIRSDWQTTLFRLTAVMKTNVDPVKLKGAVMKAFSQFPQFNVVLKPGLFWYYFQKTKNEPDVQLDEHYPCTQYERRLSVSPIHVYFKEKEIAIEFSHALTDGYGASAFLRAVLIAYLQDSSLNDNLGKTQIVCCSEANREDSYLENYDPSVPGLKRSGRAFHLPYKAVPPGIYFSTTGTVPLDKLLNKAKADGVTITVWLTAFYISVMAEMIQDFNWKAHPVVINVPVNLRPLYNSDTLRNFFVTIMPQIDCRLGHFSFEEILTHVKNYMSLEVDKRYINQQFKRNIDIESNFAVRLIPLPLKRLIFPSLYYHFGERQYSGGFSNLGAFRLPEEINSEVKEVHILVPPSSGNLIKVGCISYNNNFSITFGSLAHEKELERRFFSGLRKQGLPVRLSVNY
ncbi:MAG: hypothetical protein PQJ46_13335 [Spirochaetales bacterium]|nr:hypothetical protein [Spirochaetales bacterium]